MGWKDYPIYEMEVIKSPWFQTTNEYFHGISMGYIYIYIWLVVCFTKAICFTKSLLATRPQGQSKG